MTKEVLDIELAGIDPDCPGSEGVAEAVGVDLSNSSPHAVTSEHNVHVMIAKGPAVYGLEEVAFAPAAAVVQVGPKRDQRFIRALIVEVADLYWRFATIRRVLSLGLRVQSGTDLFSTRFRRSY